MISQTAEYALRAMVHLAGSPAVPLTTMQIAEATKVPAGYLSKVLQLLGRAGLVSATRGLHGGFVLARPPEIITILQVVNAVDPIKRIRSCPLKLPEHADCLCPLHRRLDDAAAVAEESFRHTLLSELLPEQSSNGKALRNSVHALS